MAGHRRRDLEIWEDPDFRRREWVVQRTLWVCLGVLLVAAVLGLFGRGLLSGSTARADGLRVSYERFPNVGSPTAVRVHVGARAVRNGELRLWVRRGYVESVRVDSIVPEPREVVAGDGRLVLTLAVARPGDEVPVTLHVRPDDAGPLPGRVGLVGGPSASFHQFVYP